MFEEEIVTMKTKLQRCASVRVMPAEPERGEGVCTG
jgi:hypothetical protein